MNSNNPKTPVDELTAVREALLDGGLDVSAAMLFGIGGGLSFEYRHDLDGVSRSIQGYDPRFLDVAVAALGGSLVRGEASYQITGNPGPPTADMVSAGLDRMRLNMEERGDGLEQLRIFADELTSWSELADGAECFERARLTVSESGGDGALFRQLTRDFIGEAREQFSGAVGMQLGIGMAKCAQAWNTMGDYLEAAAEWSPNAEDDEGPLHHLASVAEAAYQYESAFCDLAGYP